MDFSDISADEADIPLNQQGILKTDAVIHNVIQMYHCTSLFTMILLIHVKLSLNDLKMSWQYRVILE